MTANKLTLSIVIPVYNEARNIGACLDKIAAQTVLPDEVVVVDNNCTDDTIEIAKKYPFVRVVQETRQGRGWARTAGFNAVKNDIIGRIDADSRLDKRWVEQVVSDFSDDQVLAGVTGMGKTSFLPGLNIPKTTLFTRSYYWFVHAGFRTITMWGSTMAIRLDAWKSVADRVCNDDRIVHEDQDVSLLIAAQGGKIIQDNRIKISTSGQRFRYLPKVIQYANLFESTRDLHRKNGSLESQKLSKLGFWPTRVGWVWSVLFGSFMLIYVSVLFPVDFVIAKIFRIKRWLD